MVVNYAEFAKVGRVISNAMNKTITVLTRKWVFNSKYNFSYRQSVKFMAHDEKEDALCGDIVKIQPVGRKLSKNKRYELVEIIKKEPNAPQAKVSYKKLSLPKNI